jgi:hypothetical protein
MNPVLVAILLAFSPFQNVDSRAIAGEVTAGEAQSDLTGAWELHISFQTPSDEVAGVIALAPDSTKRRIWVALEDADYFGVYIADLHGGGSDASTLCPYPMAAARLSDDSVATVVLNPAQDHGSVQLTGTIRGAEIRGQAVESAYGAGRRGVFVMRRKMQ